MRRPWLIWSIFGLCLVVGFGATAWISAVAIELDRRDAEARRRAVLEERVRLALWRMDSALAPLIGREDARPWFHYTAFYPAESAYTSLFTALRYGDVLVPSPLLTFDSPYVKLHFQIDTDGRTGSPQAPTGNMLDLAQVRFETPGRTEQAATRLHDLDTLIGVKQLRAAAGKLELPHEAVSPEHVVARTEIPKAPAPSSVPRKPKGQLATRNPYSAEQQAISNTAEWQKRQQADIQHRGLNKMGSRLEPSPSKAAQVRSALSGKSLRDEPDVTLNVREGDMKPLWLGAEMVLLRRVRVNERELVQGCWLDWSAIRPWLLAQVDDLMPEAGLEATAHRFEAGNGGSRLLATAPVRLVPRNASPAGWPREPISAPVRNALIIAWCGVLLAVVAVVVLLRAALTLSERRGAFVSAVTHELRTPLTTFRMYTQMLAERMVPDEQKRHRYLQTLRVEADRLSHLVENVLAYARLERTNGDTRAEEVTIAQLVQRVHDRLQQRAELAGMSLVVEAPEADKTITLRTDVAAVDQILFNLIDNACKYAAPAPGKGVRNLLSEGSNAPLGGSPMKGTKTVPDTFTTLEGRIHLRFECADGTVWIRVRDHGPGVTADVKRRLFRPFSKSAREAANSAPGVGLGLALSRRLARSIGGNLKLVDASDGACFVLTLPCR